jgi:CubicO group peptidase (beta-lactamase class C family)
MIKATITTGRIMTWDEWVQAAEHLEARAKLAEQNGLPRTARSWRTVIENLQTTQPSPGLWVWVAGGMALRFNKATPVDLERWARMFRRSKNQNQKKSAMQPWSRIGSRQSVTARKNQNQNNQRYSRSKPHELRTFHRGIGWPSAYGNGSPAKTKNQNTKRPRDRLIFAIFSEKSSAPDRRRSCRHADRKNQVSTTRRQVLFSGLSHWGYCSICRSDKGSSCPVILLVYKQLILLDYSMIRRAVSGLANRCDMVDFAN